MWERMVFVSPIFFCRTLDVLSLAAETRSEVRVCCLASETWKKTPVLIFSAYRPIWSLMLLVTTCVLLCCSLGAL